MRKGTKQASIQSTCIYIYIHTYTLAYSHLSLAYMYTLCSSTLCTLQCHGESTTNSLHLAMENYPNEKFGCSLMDPDNFLLINYFPDPKPTIDSAQDDRMDILDSINSIQNQHSHPSGPKEYGFPL